MNSLSSLSDPLDTWVEAFEAALSEQDEVDLAGFLPSGDHPLFLSVLRELIRVDLDWSWHRGQPHSLTDYQPRFPDLFRDPESLRKIAFEEYRLRRSAGENPTPQEYAERWGIRTNDWPAFLSPQGERTRRVSSDALSAVARSYRAFRQGNGSSNLDAWSKNCPGDADHARLFRELHENDPDLAVEFAEGVIAIPEVGDEFLGFKLVGEIGRGAFGRVFLAEQPSLANRCVALKVAPDVGGESQTLAQLQHTHIVPVYSIHSAGPLQAVCMPYLGTVTLATVLRDLSNRRSRRLSGRDLLSTVHDRFEKTKGEQGAPDHEQRAASEPKRFAPPAPPAKQPVQKKLEGLTYTEGVLWLGTCLADGLAHAHERGILHRDIKPANVLITDEGQPMLLDFNLAEDIKVRGSMAGAAIGGTLPYMAPEHLEAFRGGPRLVDERSDVYSLGIILYELLAGKAPFAVRGRSTTPEAPHELNKSDQSRLQEQISLMIAERLRPPSSLRSAAPDVSPATEAILRRCLEPEPARRYQTARQLQEDLSRQLEHRPLAHTPEPSLGEQARKWLFRNQRIVRRALVGLVGLALLTAAAFALHTRHLMQARDADVFAGAFHDQARSGQFLITTRQDDPAQKQEAIAKARKTLEPYQVLNDTGWQKRPLFASLPAGQQERVQEEIGELLFLLARAAGETADPDAIRAALAINERAETCFRGVVPPALWKQRADFLHRLGDDSAARMILQRTGEPGSARDLVLAAREHLLAGRSREALPLLQAATRRDPQHFWASFLLGLSCDSLGQDQGAITAYSVCVALAPRFHGSWFNRGLIFLRQRDYPNAVADFDQAIELEPRVADAFINRGLARHGLGQYPAAVEDFTRALDLGTSATRVYFMRARARDRAGDPKGAEEDRAEGMRREPTDETSWVARGMARLGADPKAALADFEKALGINPRSLPALQNKAHVLAEKLKETRAAIEVLGKAIETSPEFVPARIGRGVLHARVKDRKHALEDAEEALKRDTRASVRYQVACIYALTSQVEPNDREPAMKFLTEAVRQGFGAELLGIDTDLDPLRELPEFKRLRELTAETRR